MLKQRVYASRVQSILLNKMKNFPDEMRDAQKTDK